MRIPVFAFVLLFATAAQAQEVDCTIKAKTSGAADNLIAISTQRLQGQCFGGDNDKSDLNTGVLENVPGIWRDNPPTNASGAVLRMRAALALIAADAGTAAAAAPAGWEPQFAFIARKANDDIANLDASQPTTGTADWELNDHQAFEMKTGEFAISYRPLIEAACNPPGSEADCQRALESTARLIREVELMHHVAKVANQPTIDSAKSAVRIMRKQWDYYLNEARSQYLWELALNSARYRASDHRLNAPPGDQFILLHPSAAFEYVGGGTQNERSYDAIVMLEVAGYNRFDWSSAGRPNWLPPLGASVVMTYSPDNTGRHEGYGIIFHVSNKYSIGVTRRDTGAGDETTYLLSADFMKKVINTDPETALKKFLAAK